MDAVPIVPPLFRDTKNTTLHELQTGDSSRATDSQSAACWIMASTAGRLPLADRNDRQRARRFRSNGLETRGLDYENTSHGRDTADDNAVPEGRRDRPETGGSAGRLADRRRRPWHGGRRIDRRGPLARP